MSYRTGRNEENRHEKLISSEREDDPTTTPSKCPKTWKVAVVILLVCALFLVGVVVGFYISQAYEPYRTSSNSGSGAGKSGGKGTDGKSETRTYGDDPRKLSNLHDSVVDFLPNVSLLRANLTHYSNLQLHSGGEHDLIAVEFLRKHFSSAKFDDVTVDRYEVLLSLPDPDKPSRLLATSKNNNRTVLDIDFHSKFGGLSGFVAYSPAADVTGDLIYLNHGTSEDFARAARKNIEGKIGLIRTGQTALEDKVKLAECHGLLGLMVYQDSPELHHHSKCSEVAPNALLHIPSDGDLLTPGFPAIDGVLRLPMSNAKLPKIPVQTLSCQAAKSLLSFLKVNNTLRSSNDLQIRLEVNNQLFSKYIHNVIGTMYGDKDSDYNILIGASRNSFGAGISEGIRGTDALVQISSALSKLFHNKEWLPRRTIRFISWGGADFGQLGFTEFLEKYHDIWRNKVIAYIDLDSVSQDKKSQEVGEQLIVTSSASVEVLAKMIVEQLRAKDASIPDFVWQSVSKRTSVGHDLTHSDSAAILRKLLPSVYVRVQVAAEAGDMSEDSDVIERVVSLLALTLADSGVLHIQVHRTAQEVVSTVNKLIDTFSAILPNSTADAFRNHSRQLKKSSVDLEDFIRRHLEFERPEDIRMVNSVLIQLDAEMTAILNDAVELLTRYRMNNDQLTVTDDLCKDAVGVEVQFARDVSKLLSQIASAAKVTNVAG